jgi:hypothetical protein
MREKREEQKRKLKKMLWAGPDKDTDFIENIYPLLDPEIKSDKERLSLHENWFESR